MSKRAGAGLFLALAVVFLIVNRGAYAGYFQDDEIDNISWTRLVSPAEFARGLITPRLASNNFRPVGHLYFAEAARWFRLDFPKYVAVLQALHLLNVWLIWLLARRLGSPPWAAAAACVFFAFHMALMDAFWKPMYIFDVLCATFCLASILFYAQRRWVLSFLSFWLGYKSKELAIMLPLVLACYEIWFGERRWKPLIPFFAVSLSFGLQGLFLNGGRDNDYSFRFTPGALGRTSVYYAGRVLLLPYLGFFAVLLAPWLARNRRTWFGLAMMALFFAPLLFLPGRLFSAYCYLPFTGLAVLFAGAAEATHPAAAAIFLLLWLPLDYHALRAQRRATLAHDDLVRGWMTTLARYADSKPPAGAFVYSGAPAGFERWGVEGAIHYLFGEVPVTPIEEAAAGSAFRSGNVTLLAWQQAPPRLDIVSHSPGARDASYLEMNSATPVWQLEDGWYALEGGFRWIAPSASAHLWRPADARQFTLRVNVGPELLAKAGPVTVGVSVGGEALAARRFDRQGWQETSWTLARGPAGPVTVKFQATPGYRPPGESRTLGIAVGAFGFPGS